MLSQTFYDDYDLNADGTADYAYATPAELTGSQSAAVSQVRGLNTITWKRIVKPGKQYGGWLTTVLFYDQYGNVIQKQGNNQLQTGTALNDVTSLVYRENGFVPQVLKSLKKQQVNTTIPVAIRNRYRYDAAGLLLQTWQQHQYKGVWEAEVLLSSNTYTGLGELTQKKLHSRDGVTFLQTEDFAYNIHGQLTRINQSDRANNLDNDFFGLELVRETVAPGLSNTVRYDGGISAVKWMAHNAAQQNQPERERAYTFTYDGLGRLTDALYTAKDVSTGWGAEVGAYDEKGITYDANGNIKTMQRYTQASASVTKMLLDQLTLTYTGNRLTKVVDAGDITRGFKDVTATTDYTYDANGSILTDVNKAVTYGYNSLNKVEQQKVGTSYINTTFDAAGTALIREISTTAGLRSEYFIEGVVYEVTAGVASLRSLPTPEGRALILTTADTKLTYEYHLRDHLGNLRVAFRAQAGTENLLLTMEKPAGKPDDWEQGDYPKFQRVVVTRSAAGTAKNGSYSSVVSATQPGPSNRIPVSHGDQLDLSVYYSTPNGTQYLQSPGTATTEVARYSALQVVAPMLTTVARPATFDRRPTTRVMPGISLNVLSLLQRRQAQRQKVPVAMLGTTEVKPAYIRWTLFDTDNNQLKTGTLPISDYTPTGWRQLQGSLTVDLAAQESRTGYVSTRSSTGALYDSGEIARARPYATAQTNQAPALCKEQGPGT